MKKLNNSGMAVVMALAVVLIMATTALQLHSNERNNMLTAAAMRDRRMAEQMAVSGVHLAMAMLVKDRIENETDSIQEDWADGETIKTLLQEHIRFDQGALNVTIVDEMGKIQINALVTQPLRTDEREDDIIEKVEFNPQQKKIWTRLADKLLTAQQLLGDDIVNTEETDAATIIDALKDWLDKDDFPEFKGAESVYYEELDPPYKCKNGPMDHISELRLVKGVTPELFNGIGELGGLANLITVHGIDPAGGLKIPAEAGERQKPDEKTEKQKPDEKAERQKPNEGAKNQKPGYSGKININTAEASVLALLSKEDGQDFSAALVEHRKAVSGAKFTHDLTNESWPKNIGAELDQELITLASNIFRITATAELNGAKATTTAVIRREQEKQSSPWQCKVLNWESK